MCKVIIKKGTVCKNLGVNTPSIPLLIIALTMCPIILKLVGVKGHVEMLFAENALVLTVLSDTIHVLFQ